VRNRWFLLAAGLTSGCMIAHQVGGKAVRDALFLSQFPVTRLPVMLIAAAALSVVASALAVRAMSRWSPSRVAPWCFGASAALQVGEWALARTSPAAAAIVFFLHIGALGPVLTSSFWSVSGERLDPRSARRVFGRLTAAGAFGGIVGGVAGERVATGFGLAGALLLMAGLHLACAGLMLRIGGTPGGATAPAARALDWRQGFASIVRLSYVRRLVGVVLLVTVAAALLDYVFKAEAAAASAGGADLMRLFTVFYVGTSIAAFFAAGLAAPLLRHAGLGRTIGLLPAAVAVSGAGALVLPGLLSAALARGADAVFRNSMFRAGYEVLFAPIPRDVKRATKTLIDVGGERLGDIAGGALVALTLLVTPAQGRPVLLAMALLLAVVTLLLTRRLHGGYVAALEDNLVRGAVDSAALPLDEQSTRAALFRALGTTGPEASAILASPLAADVRPAKAAGVPEASGTPGDPAADLRSGDPARVRTALASAAPAAPVVSQAIALLAWDDVAGDVAAWLRRADPAHVEALIAALVDPGRPFAVRRRLPQVLTAFPGEATVRGLLEGLADLRFEVRYRCGHALRRLADDDPSLAPGETAILEAVRREASIGRRVWASQRLIDRDDEPGPGGMLDEVLRERARDSLTHVFTLLSLVYPKEAVRLAFRGLHAGDPMARGTALEYVESILPPDIWGSLRTFLDDDRPAKPPRPSETVLLDLVKAQESIEVRLAAMRSDRAARRDPHPPEPGNTP